MLAPVATCVHHARVGPRLQVSDFNDPAARIIAHHRSLSLVLFWPGSASSAHWHQIFRNIYGSTHKAFAALAAPAQEALAEDIVALLERLNVAGKSSLVVPSECLEVVVVKH